MVISMLCWGSWANTMKLCPKFRFQLFYWDYVVGLILASLVWGFLLGTGGSTGRPFLADLSSVDGHHAGLAIVGSLLLKLSGRRHDALFVGQWPAPILLLGLYNKIVRLLGSD